MLFYMDGFDQHTVTLQGLDVGAGGMQDAGYYWRGGTITGYDFDPGYLGGRSMRVTSSGTNSARGVGTPNNGMECRIGFWASFDPDYSFNFIGMINVIPGAYWSYRGNGRFGLDTPEDDEQSAIQLDLEGWHYYEFYGNLLTGEYWFERDGTRLVEITGGWISDDLRGLSISLASPSLDNRPAYRIDHLWITEGEFPAGSTVLGVQVVGAVDLYTGGPGFRGQLVMNGQRYQTNRLNAIVSSQDGYAEGMNLVNVINYLYNEDPTNNLPWNTGSFAAIEQWGLCYGLDSAAGVSRLAGMHLAVLVSNNGMPIINRVLASAATSFSGPWVKKDPTLSFAAHIQAVPRPDDDLEEDAISLLLGGPGCVLYSPTAAPEITMVEIGLTFAEEFREDYKDFVRVDGGHSYDSWFISGYSVLGEGNRKFQDNYITINYDNVPTGAAYIQGLWDYSENADTGRWSMRQSLDNKGGDYRHGTRRLKIRGHGKALQVKVSNKGDRPFIINGWTSLVTSNTSV